MPKKMKVESREDLMVRLEKPNAPDPRLIKESKVKKQIREWLNEQGPELIHFPYSAYGGKAGVSDRIVCYKGRFIGIEVKRPSKKTHKNGGQSDAQARFEKNVLAAGGHYILAYSLDDVKDYFQRHVFWYI